MKYIFLLALAISLNANCYQHSIAISHKMEVATKLLSLKAYTEMCKTIEEALQELHYYRLNCGGYADISKIERKAYEWLAVCQGGE